MSSGRGFRRAALGVCAMAACVMVLGAFVESADAQRRSGGASVKGRFGSSAAGRNMQSSAARSRSSHRFSSGGFSSTGQMHRSRGSYQGTSRPTRGTYNSGRQFQSRDYNRQTRQPYSRRSDSQPYSRRSDSQPAIGNQRNTIDRSSRVGDGAGTYRGDRQTDRRDLRGDRQGDRSDLRGDRIDNRDERGQGRQDLREGRQGERTERQGNRQQGRTDRTETRQREITRRFEDRADFYDDYWRGYHHHYHGHYHGYWHDDDDWWVLAAGLAIGASIASLPPRYETVYVGSASYYYANGYYYASAPAGGYVVTAPPTGVVVQNPPSQVVNVTVNNQEYGYANGAYYEVQPPDPADEDGDISFKTVEAPVGAKVDYIPDGATSSTVDGVTYFVYNDTYYRPFYSGADVVYIVAENPTAG